MVISIIRIRKRLIKERKSGKNVAKCLAIIKELDLQIQAYGNKWDENGWKQFVVRNTNHIDYLIPSNKSGNVIKQTLYEL